MDETKNFWGAGPTSWGIEKNLPTWVGIDDEYMDSFIQRPSDLVPTTFEEYCNTFPEI